MRFYCMDKYASMVEAEVLTQEHASVQKLAINVPVCLLETYLYYNQLSKPLHCFMLEC